MTIAIDIPDDIGHALADQEGGASRAVLEAFAAESYRSGAISHAQVQRLLGLESWWATETFLQRAGAPLDYTIDDLEKDIATFRRASKK